MKKFSTQLVPTGSDSQYDIDLTMTNKAKFKINATVTF